jgi:hypothetical protein
MRTLVVSDKIKLVKYRTVKLKLGKFVVTESYTNGKLVDQEWSVTGGFKNTHKKAYSPSQLDFNYYEDISFLDSEHVGNSDEYYDEIPNSTLITDWDNFKGFDHILCLWMSMDSNIYRIDRATPISMWRHQGYIGGFCGKEYHSLVEFKKELEALDFIRNIEIIDIPHYNGGGKAIEFEYKATVKMINMSFQITNTHVAKIAKRFRRKDHENI